MSGAVTADSGYTRSTNQQRTQRLAFSLKYNFTSVETKRMTGLNYCRKSSMPSTNQMSRQNWSAGICFHVADMNSKLLTIKHKIS